MDKVSLCARIYSEIIQKDYYLTLEDGNELHIRFDKRNFKHLLGIHKLKDIHESSLSSAALYKKALAGDITEKDLKKSVFYPKIEKRIAAFPDIEKVFGKKIIVDFNPLLMESCKLHAEYILYAEYNEGYIHLSIGNSVNGEFAESFFYERTKQYLSGQILLEVVKIEIIQKK